MTLVKKSKNSPQRCRWCNSDPAYIRYHDREWGRPLRNDRKLFEMLILEGFQAGLNWLTILKKRENFRSAFFNFNPERISKMSRSHINKLLKDPGIIRNRLKIQAAKENALAFIKVRKEFGSFNKYVWQFTGNKTIYSPRKAKGRPLTRTKESDLMSKDLKKRGFKFVGTTICYAYMQAVGMVNDHDPGCFLKR